MNNFEYFTSGEFIADANILLYKKTLEQINDSVKKLLPDYKSNVKLQPINLVKLFSSLYTYRQNIDFTLCMELESSDENDVSIENYYSVHLQKAALIKINNSLSEIDDILCLLIDP